MIGEAKIEKEAIPVIFKVIRDTEATLAELTGYKVSLTLELKDKIVTADEAMKIMIQNEICREFDVSWSAVRSATRKREVVNARHAYCYLAMIVFGHTAEAVGKEIGDRDHTTVLYGRDNVKRYFQINDPVAQVVSQLKERIINAQT